MGQNDRRKYFMIDFHERMLPTRGRGRTRKLLISSRTEWYVRRILLYFNFLIEHMFWIISGWEWIVMKKKTKLPTPTFQKQQISADQTVWNNLKSSIMLKIMLKNLKFAKTLKSLNQKIIIMRYLLESLHRLSDVILTKPRNICFFKYYKYNELANVLFNCHLLSECFVPVKISLQRISSLHRVSV